MAQPLYQLLRIKATYTPNGRNTWFIIGCDEPLFVSSITKLYTVNDHDFYRSGAYMHSVEGQSKIYFSIVAFGSVNQTRIGVWQSVVDDPEHGSFGGATTLQYGQSDVYTSSNVAIYERAEVVTTGSISYLDSRYTFEVEYDATGGGITTDNALVEYCKEPAIDVLANGGGATSVSLVSGMMNELASSSTNRYNIIAMSGGGGGGMIKNSVAYNGNNSGGWKGSGNNSSNVNSGYTWGYGETGYDVSAGGAGYRGGYKATLSEGGGGGCANMAAFTHGTRWNRKMVGYGVPTTTGDNYTESTDQASAMAESNKAKIGDGKARISYVSDLPKRSKVMPSGSTAVELTYQSLQSSWVTKTLDEILVMVKSITMASGNHANAFYYIPSGYNTGGGFIVPMYVSSRTNLYTLTEESLMYDGGQDYSFSSGNRLIAVNSVDIDDNNDSCGSYYLNAQKTALSRQVSNSIINLTRGGKSYQASPINSILNNDENTMTYMFYTDANIQAVYVDGVKK